ncbi:MAG: hypothetical protein Q8P59_07460 [Dehalococcoidia bacterium]|nr:hypothetical protein [Dehalococcoidia bacterium]
MPSVDEFPVGRVTGWTILGALFPMRSIWFLLGLTFLVLAYRSAFMHGKPAQPAPAIMMQVEQVPVLETTLPEHQAADRK